MAVSEFDRVFSNQKDDGNHGGRCLCCECRITRGRCDYRDLPPDQVGRQLRQSIGLILCEVVLEQGLCL
jgi:hypothetical protein